MDNSKLFNDSSQQILIKPLSAQDVFLIDLFARNPKLLPSNAISKNITISTLVTMAFLLESSILKTLQ